MKCVWECKVVSELIELSSVIGDIYDAAIDAGLWQQVLGRICNYVGGYAAVLFWHDAATQNAQALHLFNDNPNFTRLYFEKYLPMDPFFPASSFIEPGILCGSTEIVPQAELEQTRFYQEWIKPQGIVDAIAVNLEKGVMRSSFLVIRTDANYGMADDRMRDRIAALVPHLQRAVAIGRLFDRSQAAERLLTETLDRVEAAVFLVGADGAISFANDPGKKMLAGATLVRKDGDALHAVAADTDRILHDIFVAAKRGDASVGLRGVAVPLAGSSSDPWFAHVLPLTSGRRQQTGHDLTAVAAVFIRKTAPNAPPPLEAIATRYGLLPSEIRVLDAVAKVQGVKPLADLLGISQATVKTHLHNLFRKTGTRRQSELVKLVAGI
jgi:DNA-binding CsgD family transcriptional regulator